MNVTGRLEAGRRHGLVGTLATAGSKELAAQHGLARAGQMLHADDEVGVNGAENDESHWECGIRNGEWRMLTYRCSSGHDRAQLCLNGDRNTRIRITI